MKGEILLHGTMIYECETCGKQWKMWLECGVGSCESDKTSKVCQKCEISEGLMPCPFMIGCACGGIAKHIDWHKDVHHSHPFPVLSHISYFALDREGLKNKNPQACGIPIVRKKSRDLRKVPT